MEYVYRILKRSLFSFIIFIQCTLVFTQMTMLLAHQSYFKQIPKLAIVNEQRYILSWLVENEVYEEVNNYLTESGYDFFTFDTKMVYFDDNKESQSIAVYDQRQLNRLQLIEQIKRPEKTLELYVDKRLALNYPLGKKVSLHETDAQTEHSQKSLEATVSAYIDTDLMQPIAEDGHKTITRKPPPLFAIPANGEQIFTQEPYRMMTVYVPLDKQAGLGELVKSYGIHSEDMKHNINFGNDIIAMEMEKLIVYFIVYTISLFISLLFVIKQELAIYKRLFTVKLLVGAKSAQITFELLAPFLIIATLAYIVVGTYFSINSIYLYDSQTNYFSLEIYRLVGLMYLSVFITLYIIQLRKNSKIDIGKGLIKNEN
ncbi:MAG: hypothetical protein ACRC6X_06475 [Culicoidibacterales bacterium]